MEEKIERIFDGKIFLGMIIRKDYHTDGIAFMTRDEDPMQLGYMNRAKDYVIAPHVHNIVPRTITNTHETLIIRKGTVRVDFYNDAKEYLESRIAYEGDVVLLAYGGHGFKMMDDAEMIEVKQGPYCGMQDKVRFDPVEDSIVIIK